MPDDPCDEPKCKDARKAYETAKDDAAAAAAAIESAKDGRNTAVAGAGVTGTGASVGASILGAGTATTTAGGWTGWGLVIGLGLIAVGATVVAIAKHLDVVELRKDCHRKNLAWRDAKEELMAKCPERCLPEFPLINCG